MLIVCLERNLVLDKTSTELLLNKVIKHIANVHIPFRLFKRLLNVK